MAAMTNARTRFALIAACVLLAGCDMVSGGGGKTTTKLDKVEVEPGTISDAMIVLDDSGVDGTAVDNNSAAPAPGSEKLITAAEKKAAAEAKAETGDKAEKTDEADASSADKPAEPAATKTGE